jgi:predicted PurR-regulated permease PerM
MEDAMNETYAPSVEVEVPDSSPQTAAEERLAAPLEKRTIAMIAAALVVVPFVLYAGTAFFIPLFVSIFMSYALSPVVDWLEKCRLPRSISAALTMVLVTLLVVLGVQQALSGTADVLEELPQAVQKLRFEVAAWQRDGKSSALKQVQKTADELQKLAGASTAGAAAAPAPAAPAAPTEPKQIVMAGTMGMAIFVGQLVSVLFLSYFILAAGDLFRRRLLQVMEPSLSARKKALQILQQIHLVSQRYFALVLAMNIVVGFATTIGLFLLDVRHPVFWGMAMAIVHTIPYLGAASVTAAVGLIAYLQFGALVPALTAAAVPLMASMLIGIGLQTVLMGPRRADECRRRVRRPALLRNGVGNVGPPARVSDHGDNQDRVRRDRAPEAGGAADGSVIVQPSLRTRLLASLFLAATLLVSSCATLSPGLGVAKTESAALASPETTTLGKRFAARAKEHPGMSGFRLLVDGADSFALRLQIAEKAEKTLDVQYFVLQQDDTGQLLLGALLDAADRGIRVRILLDDALGIDGGDTPAARGASEHRDPHLQSVSRAARVRVPAGARVLAAGWKARLPDAQQALSSATTQSP